MENILILGLATAVYFMIRQLGKRRARAALHQQRQLVGTDS